MRRIDRDGVDDWLMAVGLIVIAVLLLGLG
jgi:hypothetical protein